jgi:hypothetical protein
LLPVLALQLEPELGRSVLSAELLEPLVLRLDAEPKSEQSEPEPLEQELLMPLEQLLAERYLKHARRHLG